MNRLKTIVPTLLLTAFAFVAVSTVFAKNASALRFAIAYTQFGGTCTGNPGNDCDKGSN